MKITLMILSVLFFVVTLMSINCHSKNNNQNERIVILDSRTNKEYHISRPEEVSLPFKAEGKLYAGHYSSYGKISGKISGKGLGRQNPPSIIPYGCIGDRYFLIRSPEELKLLKPYINDEEQALVFVRFLSSGQNCNLFNFDDRAIFDILEVTIEDNDNEITYGTVLSEGWNRLGLEPTTVKQDNNTFVIERNVIKKGNQHLIIKCREKVSQDGEYTFSVIKTIPIPDNIYILVPPMLYLTEDEANLFFNEIDEK